MIVRPWGTQAMICPGRSIQPVRTHVLSGQSASATRMRPPSSSMRPVAVAVVLEKESIEFVCVAEIDGLHDCAVAGHDGLRAFAKGSRCCAAAYGEAGGQEDCDGKHDAREHDLGTLGREPLRRAHRGTVSTRPS